LSVKVTDALMLKLGFKLENAPGRFIAVGRPQFATGSVAIGVDRTHPDLQLSGDLFRGEMAIDERQNLSFALGQRSKLISPLRRI
jgi:hypothetical protein